MITAVLCALWLQATRLSFRSIDTPWNIQSLVHHVYAIGLPILALIVLQRQTDKESLLRVIDDEEESDEECEEQEEEEEQDEAEDDDDDDDDEEATGAFPRAGCSYFCD